MIRPLATGVIAALTLAAAAVPASAAPTFADGSWSGVTSEGRGLSFSISGGGSIVTGLHFVNACFPDPQVGVAVPGSMKIQTTTKPKRRKHSKRKPKPKPLAEPIFGYSGNGFTVEGTFKSAFHAEGAVRWVSPAGCDTGTLGFNADVIVQPG
jgi:hypothetical protein